MHPKLEMEDRNAVQKRREQALTRLTPRLRQVYEDDVRGGTGLGGYITQAVWDADYERKPVSFREFVKDDFFLGRTIGQSLCERLVNDGEEFFSGGWSEGVFTGAIGYGKTTLSTAMMSYDIYRVGLLKNPASAYGMTPGTEICFVNVSVNKRQAEQGFLRRMRSIMALSPYFTQVFPFNPAIKSRLEFPKGLRSYAMAPTEQAALGDNVRFVCVDEANFWQIVAGSRRQVPGGSSTYDQVVAVHSKLHQRLRSRLNLQGKVLGYMLILSSSRYPNDFTERLERQAREEAERGEIFTFFRRYRLWDTALPGKFKPETFRVEVGDYSYRSRVLTGSETDVNEANVINVPVDLQRDFERDPDGCVRDFAGISVLALRPFIPRREMIQRMFELGEAAGLRHPFSHFDVTLQHRDPGVERLLPENLHWVDRTKLHEYGYASEKKLYDALYFAHVDLSKTRDATGIVIAHVCGTRKVVRFEATEMKDVEEVKPVIRVDLVLRVLPPPQGEIDIPRVRGILYELHRRHGMEFGKVTFDSFGSQEAVKSMKDKGFSADVFSVDKDMSAYETLRTALYDERIFCYRVPVLERELSQLEYGEHKVEHPATAGGSKDLADALAAVVQHCEDSWRAGVGSRGLFQFGEIEPHTQEAGKLPAEMEAAYHKVATKGEPVLGGHEAPEYLKYLFGDNEE